MGTLKYKGYEGAVEYDDERGMLRGKVLFISDLVLYEAKDAQGIKRDFEESVDDYLDACAALGKEPQKPCTGQLSVCVPPDMHLKAVEKATRDGAKLDAVIVRALHAYLNGGTSTNVYVNLSETPIVAVATMGQSTSLWENRSVH